jgi:hypothetical protein
MYKDITWITELYTIVKNYWMEKCIKMTPSQVAQLVLLVNRIRERCGQDTNNPN